MSQVYNVVEGYIASWNETDAVRRHELIAQTFTEDARYRDPLMEGQGQDGIDAMIAAAQKQFPGFTFRLVGEVDSYGDRVRFSWALGSVEAPEFVMGSDFGVLYEGRLREITGFLDKAPVVEER